MPMNSRGKRAMLSVRGINKSFMGVVANKNIHLDFHSGEIHAILGENGAGKSTLVKILAGIYQQDEGKIILNGADVKINSPLDAFYLGIGMVHQHIAKIDSFTVLENIILGMQDSPFTLNLSIVKNDIKKIMRTYRIEIPLDVKVGDLSIGVQQRMEIIRLLYRNMKILVFDEPSSFLTPQEVIQLEDIIQSLKKEGRTIIYITHKLQEVFSISDRVSVMRAGSLIRTSKTAEINEEILIDMMIGEKLPKRRPIKKLTDHHPVLEIRDLFAKNDLGIMAINDINLTI
ncbi:MAG: ATP-binding cassette domain-containing protein, partial [Chloroflexi bacterium]|nr:ATP-binding cassette domain-containing protein [Chloroflexota bacterium]